MSNRLLGASLGAYAVGVFAADAGWSASSETLAGLAIVVALAAAASVRTRPRGAVGLGLVLLMLVGALRLELRLDDARSDLARLERVDAEALHRLEARVDRRRSRSWGVEVELDAVRPIVSERSGGGARALVERPFLPRRLLLSVDPEEQGTRADRLLRPGAVVRVAVRLAPIGGPRNPGSRDRARTWARRGIALRARLADPAWILAVGEPGDAAPSFRRRLLDRVRPVLSEHAGGGLALALVLGDRSRLSSETEAAVRVLGLSHLIAISGLHVGLVGGGVGLLALRLAGRGPGWRRGAAVVAGAVAAVGYAGLAGAGPAVQRAAILFVVAALAMPVRREFGFARALAVAALGLGILEPAWLFDLGARLSFCACAGIAFFAESVAPGVKPREHGARPVRQAIRMSIGTTVAASFATAPWLADAGLALVPWSVVSNFVAVPVMSGLVLPVALLSVLVAASAGPAWSGTCLSPVGAFEGVVVWIAARSPEWPGLDQLGPGGLAVGCGLGLVLSRRGAFARATTLWVGLALLGSPPGPAPAGFPDRPRVVYLDVGQGDAALIEGEAARVLVDTGRAPFSPARAGRVERAVRALGGRHLDALVVTHGDADHQGAADALLERLSVEALWLPAAGRSSDPRLRRLAARATRDGIPVRWLDAGARIVFERLAFEVLGPVDGEGQGRRSSNETSLVLRVEVDGVRHLLAADIGIDTEKQLLRRIPHLEAHVLKVAHHGSRGSTSEAFLAAVAPKVALVSGPCRPRRGLPHPSVLERLWSSGARLAWTGREGAVAVGRDGEDLVVASWAARLPCPRDPEASASEGVPLSADEARRALLDEGSLRLARVFGPAQRLAELFLMGIGFLEIHSLELPYACKGRLDSERRIRRDLVRHLEGARHQLWRGDDLVYETDPQGAIGIDRLGGIEKVVGVDRTDLARQGDRRLAGGIETQRDLFEREGRFRHRVAELAGQHEVEAPRSGMSIHGGDEGNPELGLHERGVTHGAQPFEVERVDLLAPGEGLGRGKGLLHVHAGTEDAVAGPRQDGSANVLVLVDPLPMGGEVAERLGVEAVGPIRSVDRHEGDMGMIGGQRESGGHRRSDLRRSARRGRRPAREDKGRRALLATRIRNGRTAGA